jgi:hypothetical protein
MSAASPPQLLRTMNRGLLGLRKLRLMSTRSNSPFLRPLIATFALASAILAMSAAPARSQAPGWDSALPPGEIAHTIEERGYQLVGPLVRHGRVYIANVLGQEDVPERLVIDAHDGRLLHHYPGDPAIRRQVGNPDEWSPVANFFDHLFGHQEEEVAPLSPPPASDFYETPKPKAQARRAKPESRPAAQPAMAPGDNKASSPAPAVTTTAPTAPPPPAATTGAKATPPAPAPETAAAAPGAPPPKTSSPKPINDVPVAPLE